MFKNHGGKALLLVALSACSGMADQPADTIVVCAPEIREALASWTRHRQAQGHRISWLSNAGSAVELQRRLRDRFRQSPFEAVVLVGDTLSGLAAHGSPQPLHTSTHLVDAKVNVKWGSEPQIASDAPYADMDGDGLPDVSIGRLPADTPEELVHLAHRIIDYETKTDFGPWRSRVNFVAGVGGFGKFADMALEMTTKTFVSDGVPPAYATTMTYGSWQSPYCPDPRDFHKTTLRTLNEGCLFWIYIGHGQRTYLDFIRTPGGRAYKIFTSRDVDKLKAVQRPPIAIFLSCYAGAFDMPQDCLSERMMKEPGGPIAVYSGSRVTMPYAMAVMSHSMTRLCFVERHKTLGGLIRDAKRELVKPRDASNNDRTRTMLDMLAKAISPAKDMLDEERAEHISLFNLMGDPLLRLPHPEDAEVTAPEEARAGDTIQVRVGGYAGNASVEFVCRRDRLRQPAPYRAKFDQSPAVLASYNQTYEMANDPVYVRHVAMLDGETKTVPMMIPDSARGPCFVRVHVESPRGFATGAAAVYVRPQKKDAEK